MPYIDSDDLERLRKAQTLLVTNHTIITTALRVYSEYMGNAATEAKANYEAGNELPLVTNNGFRMMAELFDHNAKKADTTAHEIDTLIVA